MASEEPTSTTTSESLVSPQTTSVASKFLRKARLRRDSMLSATSEPEASPTTDADNRSNSIDSSPSSSPEPKRFQAQLEANVSYERTALGPQRREAPTSESISAKQIPSQPSADQLQALTSFPLTNEELNEAKSIILDLLGWGVEPEYLVTSGLSPAVVFRVFSDLNLHLPSNLDLSDETKHLAYVDAHMAPTSVSATTPA